MKPTILISACLNGLKYRYNGTSVNDEIVNKIKPLFNLINVCPEVEIGLGIPRKPIRLHKENQEIKVIQEDTNLDVTSKLKDFSYQTIKKYEDKIYGIILKSKSPSCGILNAKFFVDGKVYGRTYGLFAKILKETLPYLPMIDEDRLKNKDLFFEFLTKVFLFYRFDYAKSNIKNLIDFHTKYKYIFMSISQKHLKILGYLIAKYKKENFVKIQKEYEDNLKELLKLSFRKNNLINTLTHMFGNVS
ncbi:MAG: DUF523 and DUF1722 domain-containing protein [Endomicrobiia bacterium]